MWLIRALSRLFGRRQAGGDQSPSEPAVEAQAPPPAPEPAPDPAPAQPVSPEPEKPRVPRSALVALIGTTAAAALMVSIPKDESGRIVEATVTEDGGIELRHIRGRQYLDAYLDIAGIPTICDGDTHGVRMGMRETEEGCRERLERQIINHARPVIACVPDLAKPERVNQLIASVSLAYNIGPGRRLADGRWQGGFCGSTAARRFNAGQWLAGCDAMLMWNKAGGKVVRGLELRRQRERDLCATGL